MDDYRFYYEAAGRICSSSRIEKAYHSCFLYIRDFIPTDSLTLHLFDPGLDFIVPLVDTTMEGGEILDIKIPLTPDMREKKVAPYLKRLRASQNVKSSTDSAKTSCTES